MRNVLLKFWNQILVPSGQRNAPNVSQLNFLIVLNVRMKAVHISPFMCSLWGILSNQGIFWYSKLKLRRWFFYSVSALKSFLLYFPVIEQAKGHTCFSPNILCPSFLLPLFSKTPQTQTVSDPQRPPKAVRCSVETRCTHVERIS